MQKHYGFNLRTLLIRGIISPSSTFMGSVDSYLER